MTADSIINRALRIAGVIGVGETPTAPESNDALTALNAMLEGWSINNLMTYCNTTESCSITSGTKSYTLGNGGDLTTRPEDIKSAYIRNGSVDYSLFSISVEEYSAISSKSVTGIPDRYLYEKTAPQSTITLYPVPNSTYTLYVVSKSLFTSFSGLTTDIDFPHAYSKAMAYNLAVELAPEYGVEPSPTVVRMAIEAKADIKTLNLEDPIMSFETEITPLSGRFDIKKGY